MPRPANCHWSRDQKHMVPFASAHLQCTEAGPHGMIGHYVVPHVARVSDKDIETVQIQSHQYWETTVQEILLNMKCVYQNCVQVIIFQV